MSDYRREFIAFAIASGVLRFGSFVTKSGRTTPYFLDAGLFNTGGRLGRLAEFYADAIQASGLAYDMVFGPAYKGIALAAATAVALSRRGRDVPYAYNRKEAKDHGEGGAVVGAPLAGRVLIVDDVMTAGTAVRESVAAIRARRRDTGRGRGVPRPHGTRLGRALRRPGSPRTLWNTGHRDRHAR